MNVKMQHRLGLDSPTSCWQHLHTYIGLVIPLYSLGLPCRISSIKFIDWLTEEHLSLLPDVLSRAQPVHLKLRGWDTPLDHAAHNLASVLQHADCSARLESLAIHIVFTTRSEPDEAIARSLVSY